MSDTESEDDEFGMIAASSGASTFEADRQRVLDFYSAEGTGGRLPARAAEARPAAARGDLPAGRVRVGGDDTESDDDDDFDDARAPGGAPPRRRRAAAADAHGDAHGPRVRESASPGGVKGRWLQLEDKRLRSVLAALDGPISGDTDWDAGRAAGSRDAAECRLRWEKVIGKGERKGRFTAAEDEAVRKYAEGLEWEIALRRERPWTEREDALLYRYQKWGSAWGQICLVVAGRSPNMVKNRWNSQGRKERWNKRTPDVAMEAECADIVAAAEYEAPRCGTLAPRAYGAEAPTHRDPTRPIGYRHDDIKVYLKPADPSAARNIVPQVKRRKRAPGEKRPGLHDRDLHYKPDAVGPKAPTTFKSNPAARKTGFVLVAGGLGERLGYDGIKLELPVELATASRLELYADYALAVQARADSGDASLVVPLCIMTSDDTDAPTRALLEAEGDFGAEPGQIEIMKQDKVAALSDGNAKLAVDDDDRWALLTKPHGHGDVHSLMRSTGIAKKWRESYGLDSRLLLPGHEPLVLHTILPALGVSAKRGFSMNSVCVPRRAGEAAGAITRRQGGRRRLAINAEYNQLDPMLRAATGDGDVNDPATGSPYPGNANVLVLGLADYVATLSTARTSASPTSS
ncbi:UTP-glucose-1-phosphate uridylyltransferase [Aureococcus anophagefferens]|nr:UTP-glucose-1-phosphate uridylyltransferase [Aureococcus anophagefferens]